MPAASRMRRSATREAQQRGQQRAEAGADLGDRPFAAAGAAGADGQGAGDQFDERHARADLALAVVIGGDGRVGAVALRLGSEAEDEVAAQQAAQCWK